MFSSSPEMPLVKVVSKTTLRDVIVSRLDDKTFVHVYAFPHVERWLFGALQGALNRILLIGAMLTISVCGCTLTDKATTQRADGLAVSKPLRISDIEDWLRRAGWALERGGQVKQSFLNVPGAVLLIPGAELQVYIYSNDVARADDTATLDPVKVSPPNMRITWIMPATLVAHENVAVIVLTGDEALRSRIRTALTGR